MGCTQGTETNLSTGQTTTNTGLSFQKTFLSIDGTQLSNNNVNMGDLVKINFSGVKGFTLENNLVYPGLSMKVTAVSDGQEIVSADNLLSKYTQEGISPSLASSLSSNLTIGNPMKIGEDYKIEIRIWDALNENDIKSEVIITIIE